MQMLMSQTRLNGIARVTDLPWSKLKQVRASMKSCVMRRIHIIWDMDAWKMCESGVAVQLLYPGGSPNLNVIAAEPSQKTSHSRGPTSSSAYLCLHRTDHLQSQ